MSELIVRACKMLETLVPILVNTGRMKKVAEIEALIEEMKKASSK